VFFVNVPIVAATLVASWVVPESRNPDAASFDVPGVVLSIVSISALVWATIEAPINGWGSPTTLCSFAIAIVLVAGFVGWELRCEHPMLELTFFRDARFTAGNLTMATGSFAFTGSLFIVTQLLQFVYGYSPLRAGFAVIPLAVASMTGGFLGPRLDERVGTKHAVAVGLGLFACGLIFIAASDAQSGYALVVVGLAAIGVGFGLINGPTADAVVGAVPRERAGIASGTYATIRQICIAMGVAVIGSLLVSGYRSALTGNVRGHGIPSASLSEARSSLGAALQAAQDLGGVHGRSLGEAADTAFIHGMRIGLAVAAGLLLLGVMFALRYLPARARYDARGVDDADKPPLFEAFID
jgi:Na+/melibiose symporter-like transporter